MTNKHFDYSIYGFCVDDETLADLSKSVKWLRDNRSRLHAADCTVHEPSARCSCGLHYVLSTLGFVGNDIETALAASAQVREGEPKYFDDVLHPDDPRRSPCVAADDTPSKSRAKRIRLEKGEPVAVAQDSHLSAPDYFWLASVLTTYGERLGPSSMATITEKLADHARRVAQLEAQLYEAQLKGSQLLDARSLLSVQAEAAEASLAACRADAERWQWLRRNASGGTIFCGGLPGGALNCDEPETEWDAAIDAARSQS